MTVRRIEISARFIRVTPEVIFTIGTCTGPCTQIPVGFCILYIIGIKQCTGIFYRESDVGGFGRYISTHGSRPADRRRTSPLEVNTVLLPVVSFARHISTQITIQHYISRITIRVFCRSRGHPDNKTPDDGSLIRSIDSHLTATAVIASTYFIGVDRNIVITANRRDVRSRAIHGNHLMINVQIATQNSFGILGFFHFHKVTTCFHTHRIAHATGRNIRQQTVGLAISPSSCQQTCLYRLVPFAGIIRKFQVVDSNRIDSIGFQLLSFFENRNCNSLLVILQSDDNVHFFAAQISRIRSQVYILCGSEQFGSSQ